MLKSTTTTIGLIICAAAILVAFESSAKAADVAKYDWNTSVAVGGAVTDVSGNGWTMQNNSAGTIAGTGTLDLTAHVGGGYNDVVQSWKLNPPNTFGFRAFQNSTTNLAYASFEDLVVNDEGSATHNVAGIYDATGGSVEEKNRTNHFFLHMEGDGNMYLSAKSTKLGDPTYVESYVAAAFSRGTPHDLEFYIDASGASVILGMQVDDGGWITSDSGQPGGWQPLKDVLDNGGSESNAMSLILGSIGRNTNVAVLESAENLRGTMGTVTFSDALPLPPIPEPGIAGCMFLGGATLLARRRKTA